MKLTVIQAGHFKLDGGAMFGVVPKQMWARMNPPADNNMCTWATRCLLIQTEDRNILIDTGLGDKLSEKMIQHFEPQGPHNLIRSLYDAGLQTSDITDVFLTHLHFDHSGGATRINSKGALVPTFPNAKYWSNRKHYDWAMKPNPRERASFLKENFQPLEEAGVLHFLPDDQYYQWLPNIQLLHVFGHTESMMLPIINLGEKSLVFCADLIPSSHHIGLPYVMAYDLRPLDTMSEKEALLEKAVEENYILFFEHDPRVDCATVKRNDRGRIVLDEVMTLEEVMRG